MVVFINQIRMKIGVMFGSPETTTGGNALKFYSSVRLDIRRIGTIKKGDLVLGSRTRVKVVKNKMAPPFREAEFDIIYGDGIHSLGDLLDTASRLGITEKSGSWYSYAGQRLGQGRDNTVLTIQEQPEMMTEIRDKIMVEAGLSDPPTAEGKEPPETDATGKDEA